MTRFIPDTFPPDLSPLVTTHPASAAYRVEGDAASQAWTYEEQHAMACAVVVRDRQIRELRRLIWDISHNDPFTPPRPRHAGDLPLCEICAGPNRDYINGQVCPQCVRYARENC